MSEPATEDEPRLATNVLGVPGIVFLVLAAVSPLTGMIVIAPLGVAVGNGGGMVVAFVVVTLVLLLFAVGYAQMSRILRNAGGFYAFVVRGLGRPMGLVTGYLAMLGYNCFVAGAIGTSGFFTATVLQDVLGIRLPWLVFSLASVLLAFLLSRRGIEVSAKILGTCLMLEVAILVLLDLSVLVRHGFGPDVFTGPVVLAGAPGLAMLFAANAFVGFEASTLFSEEAREPNRTVPRATYIAILFIGAFAAVTTWAVVSAVGVHRAQGASQRHLSAGDMVFSVSEHYLGDTLTKTMMLLLVVSLFAALLALHNSATRYLFALGRVRVLPRPLARTRPRNGAPQNAAIVQLTFAGLVAVSYWVAGLDPVAALTASMTGFGTLSILTLQLLAAVAVVVHFRRVGDMRWWRTLAAPGLGGLGLAVIVTLAVANFPTLAGSQNGVIARLPWLLPLVLVAGLAGAGWLRAKRPVTYRHLDFDLDRAQAPPAPAHGRHNGTPGRALPAEPGSPR